MINWKKTLLVGAKVLGYGLFVLLLIPVVLWSWGQTEHGKSVFVDLMERELSTEELQLRIGKLEGTLPLEWNVSDIQVSDREGKVVSIDRLHILWQPYHLLSKTLLIDDISMGTVNLYKTLPASNEQKEPSPKSASFPPPFLQEGSFLLNNLSVDHIHIEPAVLGFPVDASLKSRTELQSIKQGLSLDLDLKRIDDVAGTLEAHVLFKPLKESIQLSLKVQEPEKGILVHLINLPGLPAFNANLEGDGNLTDWQGSLKLSAGQGVAVDGKIAVVFRDTTGLDLTLNIESNVPAFLPADLQPLLASNKVRTRVSLDYPDKLNLKKFSFVSTAGNFDLSGSVRLEDKQADLIYTIEPHSAKLFTAWSQGALWETMKINGTLKGGLDRPKLGATLKIKNIEYQNQAIEKFNYNLKVYPDSSGNEKNIRWGIEGNASLEGIKGPDSNINSLTEKVDWDILGVLDPEKGNFSITSSKVLLSAGTLKIKGDVQNWGEHMQLSKEISIPELKAFSPWLSTPLEGELLVALKTDVWSMGKKVRSELQGAVNNIHTGMDWPDRVAGKQLTFSGDFEKENSGVIRANHWQIHGDSMALNGKGHLNTDMTMGTETLVKLTRLEDFFMGPDQPVKGALDIKILAEGPLSDPKVEAEFVSEKLMTPEINATQLKWVVHLQNLSERPSGNTGGKVILGTVPVELDTQFVMTLNESLQLKDLHLSGLESDVKGNLDLNLQSKLVKGTLAGVIKDSASFAQWTGQAIAGRWEFSTELDPSKGQGVSFSAKGSNVKLKAPGGWQMESASVKAKVDDALNAPQLQAEVLARNFSVPEGKLNIAEAKATVAGGKSHLDWTVFVKGLADKNFNMTGGGSFDQENLNRKIQVNLFHGDYGSIPFKILEPVTLLLAPEKQSVQNIKFQVSDGELLGDATFEDSSTEAKVNAKVLIRKFPLALARLALPDAGISGRLDGDISLSGSLQKPEGHFQLKAYGVDLENSGELDLKQGSYEVSGDWKNHQANLQAKLAQSMLGTLNLTATLPLIWDPSNKSVFIPEDQPLTGKAEGQMDLKVWNDYLSASGEMVEGKLDLNVSLAGIKKAPEVSGKLLLADGRYENMIYGTLMHPISLSLVADSKEIRVENLEAVTPNKGTIKASGSLQLASLESYDFNFGLKTDNAQLVGLDMLTVMASGGLDIKGNQDAMKVSGKIEVDKADIRLPDRLPRDVVILDYVEAEVEETVVENIEKKKRKSFNSELDLQITANNRVYVRGSGLDAELQGECTIKGTTAEPKIAGKLQLKQGTLDVLGRRLVFNRGAIDLTGAPKVSPTLDFQADVTGKNMTFHTMVNGSVNKPNIEITSTPELPQDEVLSQLLFGKSSSTLSPLEAVQLVDAAAQFVGVDSGSKQMMNDLQNSLGLDKFSINSNNPSGSPQVEAGSYLTDNVYVGVKEDVVAGTGSAVIQMEVTPNINLESDFGGENSRLGINMEWDY